MTHSPIDRISPVFSAVGMNWSGPTRPRVGWFQRSKASAPMMGPAGASYLGW